MMYQAIIVVVVLLVLIHLINISIVIDIPTMRN